MDSKAEDYFAKVSKERRTRNLALAFLRRGKKAGIPDRYLRIGQEKFESLLSPDYHSDPSAISNFVYKNTAELVKKPYILIDGGNQRARDLAGFAILFRIITCDKMAFYKTCADLHHKLSTWHILEDGHRNELADSLKEYDSVFISECHKNIFKPQYDTGSFFDEFLMARYNHERPTIMSFTQALSKETVIHDPKDCGNCIAMLSQKVYSTSSYVDKFEAGDKTNPTADFLRVRVKVVND